MAITKVELKKELHKMGIKTYKNSTKASYIKKSDAKKVLTMLSEQSEIEKKVLAKGQDFLVDAFKNSKTLKLLNDDNFGFLIDDIMLDVIGRSSEDMMKLSPKDKLNELAKELAAPIDIGDKKPQDIVQHFDDETYSSLKAGLDAINKFKKAALKFGFEDNVN